jgi:hypothetical protein
MPRSSVGNENVEEGEAGGERVDIGGQAGPQALDVGAITEDGAHRAVARAITRGPDVGVETMGSLQVEAGRPQRVVQGHWWTYRQRRPIR